MKVYLIGIGGGDPATLSLEAASVLRNSDAVVGARRMLDALSDFCEGRDHEAVKTDDIMKIIYEARERGMERIAAVFSGDTGFYSGASGLVRRLFVEGIDHIILPGLSSVQLLSSRLGFPWQDWKLVSAHGIDIDPAAEMMDGRDTFFLTGGKWDVREICRALTDAGLGELSVYVGENLSYEDERISECTAEEASTQDFMPLSVMLADEAPKYEGPKSGIPDEEFIRGSVPMTKRDVRAAILGRMGVQRGDCVWDVGAGTGSCSVELALSVGNGTVYAVECEPEGIELIKKNREKFCAWNLKPVSGKAPEALKELPKPDRVFIGGSKGNMRAIMEAAAEKNPEVMITLSAVALESVQEAMKSFEELGFTYEMVQLSAVPLRKAGRLHMMDAQNPIFILSGRKAAEEERKDALK